MNNCPDILTMQAYLDKEEVNKDIVEHIHSCSACQNSCRELADMITAAEGLQSKATLPEGFYKKLAAKTAPKPFPAALAATLMFSLAILCAYILYPGYLYWWLSVGITRQVGLTIDFILELLFAIQTLGYFWLIMVTLVLVTLEVLILYKFKIVEG